MIYFNPGPSKVYDEVGQYLQDAFAQGIMSVNHRSSDFTVFSKKAIDLMHEKLNVPADYSIMFTSSATESWEIIPQSLTKRKSLHFFNGDFGKKWFEYAKNIHPDSAGYAFDIQQLPPVESVAAEHADAEILCFTQNETSTGTQIHSAQLAAYKKLFPNALLALDTTSCLGGVQIDFQQADIIYGSVQKCFGLPAGLGILIVSPKAMARAREINDKKYYNSLLGLLDKIKDYQTNFTPNVLNIYLLSRVLEKMQHIDQIADRLKKQADHWYELIPSISGLSLLIDNRTLASDTVVTVAASPEAVENIKKKAKAAGIVLGGGYGNLKSTTFRIANFPAITSAEIETLTAFLKQL